MDSIEEEYFHTHHSKKSHVRSATNANFGVLNRNMQMFESSLLEKIGSSMSKVKSIESQTIRVDMLESIWSSAYFELTSELRKTEPASMINILDSIFEEVSAIRGIKKMNPTSSRKSFCSVENTPIINLKSNAIKLARAPTTVLAVDPSLLSRNILLDWIGQFYSHDTFKENEDSVFSFFLARHDTVNAAETAMSDFYASVLHFSETPRVTIFRNFDTHVWPLKMRRDYLKLYAFAFKECNGPAGDICCNSDGMVWCELQSFIDMITKHVLDASDIMIEKIRKAVDSNVIANPYAHMSDYKFGELDALLLPVLTIYATRDSIFSEKLALDLTIAFNTPHESDLDASTSGDVVKNGYIDGNRCSVSKFIACIRADHPHISVRQVAHLFTMVFGQARSRHSLTKLDVLVNVCREHDVYPFEFLREDNSFHSDRYKYDLELSEETKEIIKKVSDERTNKISAELAAANDAIFDIKSQFSKHIVKSNKRIDFLRFELETTQHKYEVLKSESDKTISELRNTISTNIFNSDKLVEELKRNHNSVVVSCQNDILYLKNHTDSEINSMKEELMETINNANEADILSKKTISSLEDALEFEKARFHPADEVAQAKLEIKVQQLNSLVKQQLNMLQDAQLNLERERMMREDHVSRKWLIYKKLLLCKAENDSLRRLKSIKK